MVSTSTCQMDVRLKIIEAVAQELQTTNQTLSNDLNTTYNNVEDLKLDVEHHVQLDQQLQDEVGRLEAKIASQAFQNTARVSVINNIYPDRIYTIAKAAESAGLTLAMVEEFLKDVVGTVLYVWRNRVKILLASAFLAMVIDMSWQAMKSRWICK